ncbi:hypothetical protein PSE10B_18470 [Pseudomonas amygdali pv. eriobotryae]|nr:hypothetical protein PSE10B_18470 [Pseudomonas amygdali pv. eriobotryae]
MERGTHELLRSYYYQVAAIDCGYQPTRIDPDVHSRPALPVWKTVHPRQLCKCLTIDMSLSFVKRTNVIDGSSRWLIAQLPQTPVSEYPGDAMRRV